MKFAMREPDSVWCEVADQLDCGHVFEEAQAPDAVTASSSGRGSLQAVQHFSAGQQAPGLLS
jgi:hypothetical protein